MVKKILITGGTGLIGQLLAKRLKEKGYEIHILSRNKRKDSFYKYFVWDIENEYVEEGALDVDCIFHLAGAGIADRRWTKSRKKQILDSRVLSTLLLKNELAKNKARKPIYIGASAIGIYGSQDQYPVKEDNLSAEDLFLVEVTRKWEEAHNALTNNVDRLALARIGIVLSLNGGALKPLLIPFLFRLGNYFGNGKQKMSWIHIHDMVNILIHLMENKLEGPYNAVAPNPVTGKQFINAIAKTKGGFFLKFGIPEFLLKLLFGEMAQTILMSTYVSSEKIESKGFNFEYESVDKALKALLN